MVRHVEGGRRWEAWRVWEGAKGGANINPTYQMFQKNSCLVLQYQGRLNVQEPLINATAKLTQARPKCESLSRAKGGRGERARGLGSRGQGGRGLGVRGRGQGGRGRA